MIFAVLEISAGVRSLRKKKKKIEKTRRVEKRNEIEMTPPIAGLIIIISPDIGKKVFG